MSIIEAREVLDLARQGILIPAHQVTEALVRTGDLTPFRARQMERGEAEAVVTVEESGRSKWNLMCR